MKMIILTATILLSSLGCFGETVEGHLMPSKCQNDDPKTHTKACALACQSTGLGILTANGEYFSFDAKGNKKAIELLRSTSKTADLQVTVQGGKSGVLFAVESISWK